MTHESTVWGNGIGWSFQFHGTTKPNKTYSFQINLYALSDTAQVISSARRNYRIVPTERKHSVGVRYRFEQIEAFIDEPRQLAWVEGMGFDKIKPAGSYLHRRRKCTPNAGGPIYRLVCQSGGDGL